MKLRKVRISYPPIESDKGVPLLSQNRQFQWFKAPTYIYPVVPAIAATMLKNAGYDVVWDDGIAEEKSYNEWFNELKKDTPDFIAMETKTPVVKRHWKIIDDIKRELPQVKVALFGDHVTALPLESFENSSVDYVITGGDYDFLILNLLDYLNGREDNLEPGIYWRENGRVKNSGPFSLKHDITTAPFIDRELTKWWLYAEKNGNFRSTPGTYIMSGRDCWWHKCTFCSWTTIYPTYRVRKVDNVLDEIGQLIDLGVKEIMDDTGTFPTGEWLRNFAKGMIERGYNKKVAMDCNMRFDGATPDDYKLMKKANFRFLLFGLESANQETLDRINKGLTVQQIIDSCIAARKAGLYPHITIMFGYPWETYDMALNTLKLGKWLLKKGYAYTVQATLVIPYPGTPLFEEAKKNGWLITEDWDRYDMKEPVMGVPMTDAQLKKLVQGIYAVAFNPEFVVRRIFSIRSADDLKYFVRGIWKVVGHLLDFSPKNR